MSGISRSDVNEEYAYSGIVEAGDFVYLTFCVGNVGGTPAGQVEGALDHMEARLAKVGLTLDSAARGPNALLLRP